MVKIKSQATISTYAAEARGPAQEIIVQTNNVPFFLNICKNLLKRWL